MPGPLPALSGRILVVDADPGLADSVHGLFAARGVQVEAFTTSAAALAFAKQSPFDVVVAALELPSGSGMELIPALAAMEAHAAVILVTGNATLDTAIAAVRLGAFAYVQKPFTAPELVTAVTHALEHVRLVRERAGLARELSRSEALYRGIFDTSKALIVGLDATGRLRMLNAEAEQVFGTRLGAADGRALNDIVTFEGGDEAVATIVRRARSGERVEIERTLTDANGRERRVEWSFALLGSPRGSEEITLGVGIDVTERRVAETRSMQNEALAAMGTLTLGLAHEIRNPLNAATLQLELLARAGARLDDAAASASIDKGVRIVRSELARLERMLSEFLYLARPRGLEKVPVAIAPVLREVAEIETPLAREIGVDIHVMTTDDSLTARGDREKIKQLVINLVVNALDALRGRDDASRGGGIRLAAKPLDERTLTVVVQDTGPGVAPEVLDTLFEPFVTTKKAGTGLGLTIAKKIVEQHEGTIAVESPPGGGTIARVTLPRA